VFPQKIDKQKPLITPKKVTPFEVEKKTHLKEVSGSGIIPSQTEKKTVKSEIISPKINDLLSKFDTITDSQSVSGPLIEIPTVQQKQYIQNNKTKDKSASSNTKNELLQALEKVKTLRDEKQSHKKPQDQNTLQQTIVNAVTDHTTILQEASNVTHSTQKTIPKESLIQKPEMNTVREVPEDILKKILE
jgi:hypothetical protein